MLFFPFFHRSDCAEEIDSICRFGDTPKTVAGRPPTRTCCLLLVSNFMLRTMCQRHVNVIFFAFQMSSRGFKHTYTSIPIIRMEFMEIHIERYHVEISIDWLTSGCDHSPIPTRYPFHFVANTSKLWKIAILRVRVNPFFELITIKWPWIQLVTRRRCATHRS